MSLFRGRLLVRPGASSLSTDLFLQRQLFETKGPERVHKHTSLYIFWVCPACDGSMNWWSLKKGWGESKVAIPRHSYISHRSAGVGQRGIDELRRTWEVGLGPVGKINKRFSSCRPADRCCRSHPPACFVLKRCWRRRSSWALLHKERAISWIW